MAEIGISIAAKAAEYLVVPVLHHARFFFCAGKIKRNLDSTKGELIKKQENVQKQKQDALIRVEIIDEAVDKWLNEVSSIMEEVEQLEGQMKEGSCCYSGWCSNLKGYHLCKQFAKITKLMEHLNQSGEFNPFSRPAPIPDIEFFSSENFVYFESTILASIQLLEALVDDGVNMIGLYGMGGSGKTTLAIEMGKKAKEFELFDRVIITSVSQNVSVRKIQDEIVDLLGFNFKSKSEAGRARELAMRIESGEQILIILDDVWSKLNLEAIGIPLHNNPKGCKVLLTTRRQQVCNYMDCERVIPLALLSDEEAWSLFQKHNPTVYGSSSTFLNVAKEIVNECQRLPIAIVAVARSLKRRSIDGWNVTLHKLRTSKSIDVEEGERDAYSCLELSYNYLQREAKLLLKICSMFPEDHDIFLEDLFRYGVGLGICGEVDSFEVARSMVNNVIDDLIDSSLLLLCENYQQGKTLKIHDMVRDMILWIASKEDCAVMVDPERDLNAFVENGSMQNCYAISLWHKEIDQFPQYLAAPKLEILLLHSRHQLKFSHASFEGMKELKVMSVNRETSSRKGILLFPLSTQLSNNLHTLRLVNQKIGDISFVLSLRRLEILDLSGSEFKNLPNGIENLNELKLMDLSNCKIEEDFSEVIGRCSQLAELYLIFEVALAYQCFLYNTFPKLQRYRLDIGGNCFRGHSEVDDAREFRVVRFRDLNISNSCATTIKDLLQRADSVRLDRLVGGCTSMIPEFVEAVGTMNELSKLCLYSCSEIECISDTTASVHADSKAICGPPSLPCVFGRLEYLWIERCHKLTSIFPLSVAQSLMQLEYLIVKHCLELKHIIIKEENNGSGAVEKEIFPNLKGIQIISCNKLECIFPISAARTLLLLRKIDIYECGQLKHIIMNEGDGATATHNSSLLTFPKLTNIWLKYSPLLKCIFSGKWDLCSLKSLEITFCRKLALLFPLSVAQSLLQLEDLIVEQCSKLKHIIVKEEKNETDAVEKEIFPNLKKIQIEFCHELECIFPVSVIRTLPSLQDIEIRDCCQLKNIIMNEGDSATTTHNSFLLMFPQLKRISVDGCGKLECIFPGELNHANLELRQPSSNVGSDVFVANESQPSNEVSAHHFGKLEELKLLNLPALSFIWMGGPPQSLVLQYLRHLHIQGCGKLKSIFSTSIHNSFPELTELFLYKCDELEEITAENKKPQSQNLSSTQPCFPKLKRLTVMKCNKLKSLLPVSMAVEFPQLVELHVYDSLQLEQAFRYKYEDVTCNIEEIMLPSLNKLILEMLPNFADLCFGLKIHAVKLRKMIVHECPKLDSIFQWSTEALVINEVSCLRLGSTFVGEREKIMTPNLRSLDLKYIPEIMFIWKGPTLINFQILVHLEVVACRKLKFIFPACVVRSLPLLKSLIIKDCEGLEQVFGCASEIHDHDREVIEWALPKLRMLVLSRLLNITDIGGNLQFQLKFQNLEFYKVEDCPNFSSTTNAAIENFVHIPDSDSDSSNSIYCKLYDEFGVSCHEESDAKSEEQSDVTNSDKEE